MDKIRKGQFWQENSTAINHDDNIIYIQSSAAAFDERIVLKITSCDLKEPITHYRAALKIHEVEALIAMLHNARHHYNQMNELWHKEQELNKEFEDDQEA